jgi:hypothetical protein
MLRSAVCYKLTDVSEVLAAAVIRTLMEAESISEKSVNFQQTTDTNIPISQSSSHFARIL